MHRAPWPAVDEVATLIDGRLDAAALAQLADASEVTAEIRKDQSQRGLGFGVPVVASLLLPNRFRASWPVIRDDVVSGNNVSRVHARFDAETVVATVEPDANE